MNENRENNAFTLAEILITLGIIGVVAAITIPNLITQYRKQQVVTKLKDTYGMFSQVMRRSVADNGNFYPVFVEANSSSDFSDIVKTYILPYLKISKKLGTSEYANGYTTPFALSNPPAGYFIQMQSNRYQLLNGMIFALFRQNGIHGIWVDLNGNKKPNTMGKDVFAFRITPNATIEMEGIHCSRNIILKDQGHCRNGDTMEYYYDTHCKLKTTGNLRYAGGSCGALIEKDGWKISKDYPW